MGISRSYKGRLSPRSSTAIEDSSVSHEQRYELGGFILDADATLPESLCGGDVARKHTSRGREQLTGSELNAVLLEFFFSSRIADANGNSRYLLIVTADFLGWLRAIGLYPTRNQPFGMCIALRDRSCGIILLGWVFESTW